VNKALIEGATNNPGAPKGMEDSVGTLPIRVSQYEDSIVCDSAWRPTQEEIFELMKGGFVVLRVVGWQPPVSLHVVDKKGATEL
jgi:hypothetical protein